MSKQELRIRLDDHAFVTTLADRAADILLSQPLTRFLSPQKLLGHLDAALDAPLVDRALRRHVADFCRRDRERAKARGDRLGDYLTTEAVALLRRELGKPVVLDRAFLEAFVKQEAIRHLLRSIVEETLQRFVQALRPGGKNGLLGGLPKGPGLGLLTRMAEQIEAQVQRAAAAFVSTSLEVLLGRLVHILATPETAEQLGRLRLTGLDALLRLRTRAAWNVAQGLPIDAFLALVPSILRHNLARGEIRVAVTAESEAVLSEEGTHPINELLGDPGAAAWREIARQILPALLEELARAGVLEDPPDETE